MALNKKKYKYEVFDYLGNYLGVLNNIASDPNFLFQVNSGVSELKIVLAKSTDDFNEGTLVDIYNRVKLWCYDSDTQLGTVIFDGYIESYTPNLDGVNEFIDIRVVGWASELELYMLEDYAGGGDTKITYTSEDPSDILTDILSKYNTLGGKITAGTIETTGNSVSYTFNTASVFEAIEQVRQMSPASWYWIVDPATNQLHFKEQSATPDHILAVGNDVINISPKKNLNTVVNQIFFTGAEVGGTPIYKKYSRSSSISNYGRRSKKMVDGIIEVESTMDTIAGNYLDYFDAIQVQIQMDVLDNNGISTDFGVDIESFKPGQTVTVRNYNSNRTTTLWDVFKWDVAEWDYSLQDVLAVTVPIVSMQYTPDLITLTTATKLPFVSRRIEDINRNLLAYQTKNNPTTPS